jgi:hypothetical protein
MPAVCRTFPMVLVLSLYAAGCGAASPSAAAPEGHEPEASGSSEAASRSAPITLSEGTPTEAGLRAVAQAVTKREGCEDTCCLGDIPSFVQGAGTHKIDASHVEDLRAIVDKATDARARALALLWLAQAVDTRDIDRMAALVDSEEPAGRYPAARYGQAAMACYPVRWEPKTLGRVSLDALEIVAGTTFQNQSAFYAWRKQNPDPGRSIAYWERVLGRMLPSPPALLARLRATDEELYAKVLLAGSDGDRYGAGEAEIVRAARNTLGPARILRALGQEETWPELAGNDERLARLAIMVLTRADAIFDASHAPALRKLWEQGALRKSPAARATLAVATSRVTPAEQCRILGAAIDEVAWGHSRLLEEIASRCATPQEALLRAWFYGPRVKAGDAADSATAILKGLKSTGTAARPALKALVKPGQPIADDPDATEALIEAAIAAGSTDPFPERGDIRPPMLKNLYAGEDGKTRLEAAEAKAAAARRASVGRVIAWLASR